MGNKNLVPLSAVRIHGAEKHDDTVVSASELNEVNNKVEENITNIEDNSKDITSTNTDTQNNANELNSINAQVQNNSSDIEDNSRDITNLDGNITTLESRVSNNENDISQLQSSVQNVSQEINDLEQDTHNKMHGAEQHNTDFIHSLGVGYPPYNTRADVRGKLPEGMAVYIRDENEIIFEDGTQTRHCAESLNREYKLGVQTWTTRRDLFVQTVKTIVSKLDHIQAVKATAPEFDPKVCSRQKS